VQQWLGQYAWAVWLAVPLVLTVLAGLVAWWMTWRTRPARQPTTDEAMKVHTDYLAVLERVTGGSHSSGH
jgi:hypothetical protein